MTEHTQPDWMDGFVHAPTPQGGRWPKGQSGNPRGRPRGIVDTRSKITKSLLDDGAAIVRVVVDAALAGDLQACNIVLGRIAPAIKPQAERVAFDFDATAPIPLQIEAVLSAVAEGVLAPDIGQTIISSLGTLADARAVAELEDRIAKLEGTNS